MSGKIKQPISHGVARVPMVMQLEALECGAACLTMVLAYYDKWIPLEQIRTECGVSRDGSNAGNMMKAARLHGLKVSAYRMEPEALEENGSFPCIVHWEFNHFVVVNGIKGNKVYLNDPARGSCTVSRERFDEGFTGICILLEPGEDFAPSGKPKSMMSFVKKRLKGTGPAIAFTAVTGIIAALMGIINPAFSRVFIDELLSGKNPGWLMPFLLLLAGFSLLQIAASALQSIYSLRISGKMAAVGNAEYMWKVLRLPMSFFSQRMAGDIQGRQSSNAQIANTLINTLAPLLLNAVMLLFYLVVMIRYSLILTLVGVLSLAINTAVSALVTKKRVNIMRVSMRESAKLSAAAVAGIEMIETIKAGGAENGYFAKWSGYQAAVNTENVKAVRLNQLLGIVPQLVNTLANSAVLILGVWLAMNGELTVGMIMAFQGFLTAFTAPAMTMISAGQTVQEMRTQMERVDDVMEYPEDRIFAEDDNEPEHRKLSGSIEIKDISFGYSPLAKPLIENFELSVKPGQSVAIVGASGCGKSTVSKLISGLYKPWSGEILFDGKKMSEISSAVFRSSLAVVDQDIILFEDTIENNIKMWDSSIEDFEMILAARDAQIHYDIMQRPDGYQGRLTEGGRDLSGGQRQRLEIARVLAQDPTIIILDEATSALDAKTEYDVVRSVRDRGITCIVIAHRLSSIRSCDEIIVMDSGRIVDRGTHAELLEKCSVYRELVASE